MRSNRILFILVIFQITLVSAMPVASGAATQVVPSEPFGLNASNWNGVAHIWWQGPNQTGPGITYYDVYRQINGTGSELVMKLNATEREFNDVMPSSAVNVTYWIIAENTVGTGNSSDKVTLVPSAHPSVPTGLRAEGGGDYVDISWNTPASDGGDNITKYVVRRQMASSGESFQFDVFTSGTSVPVTSVHDEQASSGETYNYNVKAVTNQSESGYSDSVTVTSLPKDINDDSGLLSVFALIVAVIAFQLAMVALYVVVKRKAFKPKEP